jgi:long-subunit fatty acid transport protein
MIRGWYSMQLVGDVTSGLSLTTPQEIKENYGDQPPKRSSIGVIFMKVTTIQGPEEQTRSVAD